MSESSSSESVWLGCVADDVTGATDLAINLVQGGMRVVQFLSVPTAEQLEDVDCDAVVVALKTRSIPAGEAVAQSVEAIVALQKSGCQRFFFKYCSTFDSTEQGNIGPVADALLELLDVDATIVCPAFPRNGRTVYQGHLFVYDRLLNDSGMEHHPLNPMHDADLVRFLGMQSTNKVGLINYDAVSSGPEAIANRLFELKAEGLRLAITDCCNDGQLLEIANAIPELRLVTGGSGIARFLPVAWRESGMLASQPSQPTIPEIRGNSLILAGSCSGATRRQVKFMMSRTVSFQIDVRLLMEDAHGQQKLVKDWLERNVGNAQKVAMIYSSADDSRVEKVQAEFGREAVCDAVERFHSAAASFATQTCDVRRLVVAGGETSGAVVNALGINRLTIGPEICAGVPWTQSDGSQPLAIALKSGNFGGDDFFETALEMLP